MYVLQKRNRNRRDSMTNMLETFLLWGQDRKFGYRTPEPESGHLDPEPRSYEVETLNGGLLRRNRRHFQHTAKPTRRWITSQDVEPQWKPAETVGCQTDKQIEQTIRPSSNETPQQIQLASHAVNISWIDQIKAFTNWIFYAIQGSFSSFIVYWTFKNISVGV